MKKHLKADKNLLNEELKNKYGVDLAQYKNPDIVEKIGDLLLLPKYVLKYVSTPILFSFLIYIGSFFILDFGGFGLDRCFDEVRGAYKYDNRSACI